MWGRFLSVEGVIPPQKCPGQTFLPTEGPGICVCVNAYSISGALSFRPWPVLYDVRLLDLRSEHI